MARDRVVKLTASNVMTLPAKDGRRTDYTDALRSGLVLRVSPSGHRSFAILYWTGQRRARYTIGPVGRHSLAQAREAARKIGAKADLEQDPQAEKMAARKHERQQATTLGTVAEQFLRAKPKAKGGGQWRPKTEELYRLCMSKYILPALSSRSMDDVTKGEVRLFLERIRDRVDGYGGPTQADNTRDVLSRLYTWALARELASTNPLFGLEQIGGKKKRQRFYSNDEVRQIFEAVPGTELENYVPLLFHTATRRTETAAIKWSEIDLERKVWTIPTEKSKTGEIRQQAHEVPLSKGALAILSNIRQKPTPITNTAGFLFPADTANGHMDNPKAVIKRLKSAGKLPADFMLHPIRSTVAQRMKRDLGIPPAVIEELLGHALPTIAQIYMPGAAWPLTVEAADRWSAELARLLKTKRAKTA